MNQWHVKELSDLTMVSVRTLHHYDQIGLLKPSNRLSNGYRIYSEADLLKLQQILALKSLGFNLSEIKELIKKPVSILDHLKTQAKLLEQKAQSILDASLKLNQILAECGKDKSISPATVLKLIEVFQMENKNWHKPDSNKQKEYESYLLESGKVTIEQMDASRESTKDWTESDFEEFKASADKVNKQLCAAMLRCVKPESEEAQKLIEGHFLWVKQVWTPDKESYKGLAQMYLDHEGFRNFYDAYHEGLTDFIVAAMKTYAENKLT